MLKRKKIYVMGLIENAINNYNKLEGDRAFLNNESSNYHLNIWKTYLAKS